MITWNWTFFVRYHANHSILGNFLLRNFNSIQFCSNILRMSLFYIRNPILLMWPSEVTQQEAGSEVCLGLQKLKEFTIKYEFNFSCILSTYIALKSRNSMKQRVIHWRSICTGSLWKRLRLEPATAYNGNFLCIFLLVTSESQSKYFNKI